jgi:hypothetical protein
MMHAPALAMAWELWGRNRAGMRVLIGGVIALALLGFVLPRGFDPASGRLRNEPLFIWSVILFAVAYLYVISIALYSDVRAGQLFSGLPARMFTLPVRTSMLVAWPMLYGIGLLVALWLAMTVLIWVPAGADVQWYVLPLLIVSLVWFQAVCWAVPGSPLTKIIALCVIFPALKMALEMLALWSAGLGYMPTGNPTTLVGREALIMGRVLTLTIFCAVFIPLAYVVAAWGVARDRRGAYQGRAWLGLMIDHVSSWLPKRRGAFASPERAQLWFEWRKKGLILPLFPACFLLFVTAVMAPFVRLPELLSAVAIVSCLTLVLAFFVGYGLGKTSFWGGDLALPALQATRPLTSAGLAAAKVHTAALSSLATWLFVFLAVPIWLVLLGHGAELGRHAEACFEVVSGFDVAAGVALGFVSLFALTWCQLVGGLCLSVTGRPWVVNAAVAFYLVLVAMLIAVNCWAQERPEDFAPIMTALSWGAAGLVGVKLLGAGAALAALHRRRLLEGRLGIALALWIVGAACLLTLVYWLVPLDGLPLGAGRVPALLLALTGILMLPLVRLIAAPLALAWNRVR